MASILKRNKPWRVLVRRKGKTITATFDTKAEAEAWAITTEGKIIEGTPPEAIEKTTIEPAAPEGTMVAEAFKRYSNEVSPNKRGGRWEKIRHGDPVRTIHSAASTNIRLSRPDEPRVRSSPMMCRDIRSH